MNSVTLMRVLKKFSEIFPWQIWQEIECNVNFTQWFNVFLVISEAWQGYKSKAYWVSNHNLKLQPKKLSRTRDIPNFPTQGWADTAFYTCKQSETYAFSFILKTPSLSFLPPTNEGVCLSTGVLVSVQGGGLCAGGLCPVGSLSSGVSVQGESLSRGSLSRGIISKGSLSRGVSVQGSSLSWRPPYNNEWAVHILLECILVNT